MVFAILFRTTIDSFDITSTDPETWPGAHAINNFVHEYSFYANPSIQTNPKLLTGEVPWWFIRLSNWLCHCCGISQAFAPPIKNDGLDNIITTLQRGTCAVIQSVVFLYLMSI